MVADVPPEHPRHALPVPPVAPVRTSIRERFGENVEDPYAWMGDRSNPEFLAYLAEENAYAAALTEGLQPLADTIFGEIKARTQETDLSVPVRWKEHWYYTRTVEGLEYPIEARVSVTDYPTRPQLTPAGPPAGEQILLDHNEQARGRDFFAVGASSVSPDERLLAYAADTVGDERYDLCIVEIDTGQVIDTGVQGIGDDVAWSLDGRHLFYTRHDAAWRAYQIWRHTVGSPSDSDELVLQEDDAHFWVSLGQSRDERYLLAALGSKTTTEWHLLDAADPLGPWHCLSPRRPGVEYDVDILGDRIFLSHNKNRPNFEFAVAPVGASSSADWVNVPLTSPEEYLTGIAAFDDFVVLSLRSQGLTTLRIVPIVPIVAGPSGPSGGSAAPGGSDESAYGAGIFGAPHDLDVGEELGVVALGENPDPATRTLLVEFSSLVTPTTTIDYDVPTRERTVLKQLEVLGGYHPTDYEQWRDWAVAADGTRIPLSLVRRRDAADGAAPVLLYGYGAYGACMEPSWRMTMRSLSILDRGFVFAIAHVRGGAELGRLWYDLGRLTHKTNTFTDFVACADHLAASGWADPDRIAALGGSAGGLLMGAVANLAPERFRLIHAAVPFVDALTTILDETLPLTVGEWEEWGDAPHDEAAYRLMRSYTPYENVRPMRYPTMLVTADLNDTRVFVTEPAKWVARLRAAADIDPAVNPVIFRVQTKPSSHLGQSGRYDRWRQEAWEDAVLVHYVGMPTP